MGGGARHAHVCHICRLGPRKTVCGGTGHATAVGLRPPHAGYKSWRGGARPREREIGTGTKTVCVCGSWLMAHSHTPRAGKTAAKHGMADAPKDVRSD